MAEPQYVETRYAEKIGVRVPVFIGLGLFVLVFVGAFGWASTAKISSAVLAHGTLSVEGKRVSVQHLEGGILQSIEVKEGDRVKKGEVLARLDQTQVKSKLERLHRQLAAKLVELARLEAEHSGRQKMDVPEEFFDLVKEQTERARDIQAQNDILATRRDYLNGREKIASRQIAQLEEQITGLRGQIMSQQRKLALITEELDALQNLVAKGFARRPRLLELRRQAETIRGALSKNRSDIASARQKIAETELSLLETKTQFLNEVNGLLNERQNEITGLREEVRATQDVFERTTIKAPVTGTIVDIRFPSSGAVIGAQGTLLDIVPSDERILVNARIKPADIDSVQTGMEARVQLSAFRLDELEQIKGRVETVSADSLIDDVTKQPYFLAIVSIEDIPELPKNARLFPGMQADIFVITGERTPISYIVEPFSRFLGRALIED